MKKIKTISCFGAGCVGGPMMTKGLNQIPYYLTLNKQHSMIKS